MHEVIVLSLDSCDKSWLKLLCVIDAERRVHDAYFSTCSGVSATPLAITYLKITSIISLNSQAPSFLFSQQHWIKVDNQLIL